jgi:hypothetical protein
MLLVVMADISWCCQRDVQERELSIIREYEAKLLAREEEIGGEELRTSTAISESLARLSHVLRQFLRTLGGEDPEQLYANANEEDREPWNASAAAQHALERETELARLEKENEDLRQMLGLVGYDGRRQEPRSTFDPARMVASHSPPPSGSSQAGVDGPVGTVRPYNIYKLHLGG